MDIEAAFSLRFWMNLGRKEDRRVETEARLEEAGVTAERFAAVGAKEKRSEAGVKRPEGLQRRIHGGNRTTNDGLRQVHAVGIRGYETPEEYTPALTQRLALREARRRGAPAVLLLGDDIVFHPNFRALVGAVDLPDDWGIFYLGCAHSQRPEWAGTRVVRVRKAVGARAVAIRAPYYRQVMEMLDRHGKPGLGVAKTSDQFLALLHREIPSYACYPNLAWQDEAVSDPMNKTCTNYTKDGRQKNGCSAVKGLLGEVLERENPETRIQRQEIPIQTHVGCDGLVRSKLGLLFLTRGDVNHPEIWREFVAEAPGRVQVFSHPKFRVRVKGGFLEGTALRERFETQWGDISLVRASRAMLLAGLEDKSLTHFALLSEACVPVRPLAEILRRLDLDPRPQFSFKTLKEASARQATRAGAVPEVPVGCWRFTPQWWLLDRSAAILAAGADYTQLFAKMQVPDEAYFATVLSMQGYPLEGEVVKKNVTWTHWEEDAGSPTTWKSLPHERLEEMLHSGALFARKFPPGADIHSYNLHRSTAPCHA